MEEDIKILEEYIEWVKKEGIEVCGMEKELLALENLITRYKELEERNRDLEEDNYAYHQLMRMQNEREYRSKFLKDFQKEYGKNVMPDYDEIYERYDKQKKQLENSIPKSKLKEFFSSRLEKYQEADDGRYIQDYLTRGELELVDRYKECKEIAKIILEEEIKAEIPQECIPKSLVKEKIEEYNKREKEELKGMKGQDRYFVKQMYNYMRKPLEELLREE